MQVQHLLVFYHWPPIVPITCVLLCDHVLRGGFISSNIRAAQLEAVKAAQQKALAMLREMNTALGECTGPRSFRT
jgi:hypothetical protein